MTEEDVIKKLETIKVSGYKDYIYNFEAGTILNLIQKQQEEIELLKEQQQYVIDEYEETIEMKGRMIDLMLDMLVRVHSDDIKVEFIANQNIEEKKEQAREIIERKAKKHIKQRLKK